MNHKLIAQEILTIYDTGSTPMAQSIKKTVFQLWRAKQKQSRAYEIFNTIHSFDIEEKFQKNFAALKERLKKRIGPYSEEMIKLLDDKLQNRDNKLKNKDDKFQNKNDKLKNIEASSSISSILTPEEKNFMKLALQESWFASHVTSNIKKVTSSKKLCSPEELRRQGIVIDQVHTDSAEGHQDHVFFSLAPSDSASTVRFLDNCHDLIKVNLERVKETEPTALFGLWMSDHLHAYRSLQESEPVMIFGSKLQICYRFVYDEQAQRKEKIKQYRFTHRNGKTYIQTIKWGEEIFGHPKIEIAVVLMTIEKLRLLGKEAWEAAMSTNNVNSIKILIQTIFHSGVVELHKPAEFRLNMPGVLFLNRLSNYDFDTVGVTEKKELTEYMQKLFWGFEDEVLLKLKASPYLNPNQMIPLGLAVLNLFNAAILSGSVKVVKYLIKRGVDAHISSYFIGDDQAETQKAAGNAAVGIKKSAQNVAANGGRGIKKVAHNLEINCLVAALMLSDPTFINKKIIPDILSCESNLKISAKVSQEMLTLLTEEGFPATGEKEIRSVRHFTTADFNLVMSFIKPDAKLLAELIHKTMLSAEDISLCLGVRNGSLALVNAMLDKGALPNKGMLPILTNKKDWENEERIIAGTTPLMQAIHMNRQDMVELLIKKKADVNRAFYGYNSNFRPESIKALAVYRNEGYTPLMLSLSLGYKHKAIVKLLLESGALAEIPPLKQLNRSNTFTQGLDQNAKLAKYHRRYYMLTCLHEGERFFVLLTNKHFDLHMELPVDSTPMTPDFTVEDWLDKINRHWNLELNYSETTTHSLGRFRYISDEPGVDSEGIQYSGVDYMTEVVLIDLGKYTDNLWKKAYYFEDHFKLVQSDDILDSLDQNTDDVESLQFLWEGFRFNTFAATLLASLTKYEDTIKNMKNKFAEFQKAYEFYHDDDEEPNFRLALAQDSSPAV